MWDGASIHRCQAVKDFRSQGGAKRIHLERLPGYAPELNPQEGVWNVLKRRELKNLCARDLQHLEVELVRAKERLRHRTTVLSHRGWRPRYF
jgi:transposase